MEPKKEMLPREVYEAWFDHLQAMHASNPDRHPNQVNYDQTLKENYPWVFFNLRQTEVPMVCHDIGCAYGTMSLGAYSLGYQTYAVDVTDKWVNKLALETRGVSFVQHNIEVTPLSHVAPKADVVIFTEVLEHLNTNPLNALLHIREGMKDGGMLILSTPRRECGKHEPGLFQSGKFPVTDGFLGPYTDWTQIPSTQQGSWVDAHTYVYTEPELRFLVSLSGFTILSFGLAWNGITSGLIAFKDNRTQSDVFSSAWGMVASRV